MMMEAISIPVYFAHYNTHLESIIMEIKDRSIAGSSNKEQYQQNKTTTLPLKPTTTSWEELISLVAANGYQVSVTGTIHTPTRNCKMPIIHGELMPPIMSFDDTHSSNGEQQYHPSQIEQLSNKQQQQLPTIVITANLKTFGLYDVYPLNADAAILLTLMDIFSKLYHNRYLMPKYRMVFLLTESEHIFNYQSTKKWLEENTKLIQVIIYISTIIYNCLLIMNHLISYFFTECRICYLFRYSG